MAPLALVPGAIENGCDWDVETCANAAKGGHLEVLKWARENGCKWDEYTCQFAAEQGHIKVKDWAKENGCDFENRIDQQRYLH